MPNVIPHLIREIRKSRGKSKKWLLNKASKIAKRNDFLSERTLQRIELSQESEYSVQDNTLADLALTFEVDPKVLTGDLPVPAELSRSEVEPYETRLAKLDSSYVIVEFRKSDPIGRIIARDIPDEAAGLRLTAHHPAHELLREAYNALHFGNVDEYFSEDEYYEFLDAMERQLGNPAPQNKPQHKRTLKPALEL